MKSFTTQFFWVKYISINIVYFNTYPVTERQQENDCCERSMFFAGFNYLIMIFRSEHGITQTKSYDNFC